MVNTPRNKPLNGRDREALKKFAFTNIKCAVEHKALRASYSVAKPYVLAAVHAKFPVADMKIMERYGSARSEKCIRFGGYGDNDSVFTFDEGDADTPLVPRHGDCSSRSYDWSVEAREALTAYALAGLAFKKSLNAKRSDYQRLIDGSRTFNDVAAVWPAVEAIRTQIIPETPTQRALAVLSEDALARIKADNAGAA